MKHCNTCVYRAWPAHSKATVPEGPSSLAALVVGICGPSPHSLVPGAITQALTMPSYSGVGRFVLQFFNACSARTPRPRAKAGSNAWSSRTAVRMRSSSVGGCGGVSLLPPGLPEEKDR